MNYRGVECRVIEDNCRFYYNNELLLDKQKYPLSISINETHKIKGFIDCLIAVGYI